MLDALLRLIVILIPMLSLTLFRMSCAQVIYILTSIIAIFTIIGLETGFTNDMQMIIVTSSIFLISVIIIYLILIKYGIGFNQPLFEKGTYKTLIDAFREYFLGKK